jgi:hypothetical protein
MAFAAPLISAGISAGLPYLLDLLSPGKKGQMQQTPTMSKEQQAYLQQYLGGLGGATQNGMQTLSDILSNKPGATEAFERPYISQFYGSTVPKIAEQFTGLGAQGSSAFGQQMGAAGAGLQEQLAALRGGLQQQALGLLGNFSGQALGARPFENTYQQGSPGMGTAMAPGIGMGMGQGLMEYLKDYFKNNQSKSTGTSTDAFNKGANPSSASGYGQNPMQDIYNRVYG